MSWILRDKVELKRGKQYAFCSVVMCINSQKISVAHWIYWMWARFGNEKKGQGFALMCLVVCWRRFGTAYRFCLQKTAQVFFA